MKKYGYLLISMVMSAGLLCGCAESVPQMSDEEEAMVTEYATNLLVKYSPLADRALLNEEELEKEIKNESAAEERQKKTKELEQLYLNASTASVPNSDTPEAEMSSTVSKEAELVSYTLSEVLQEEDFSIDYTTYILCDSYPENSEDEFYMAMDATPGKQLCVVSFTVSNLTDSERELNVLQKKCRFSLQINGSDTIQAQATLLMNDLVSYKGTIPAGANVEAVLVFEVPDDLTQADTMELTMTDAQGSNTILLK